MAEDDVKKKYPPLPSNYVSLVQLQERWLSRNQKLNEEEREEQKQKQQQCRQTAAQKQHPLHQPHRQQEYYCKNNYFEEKYGKSKKFDRPGYDQRAPFKQKGKGKARVEEVEEKHVDLILGCSGKTGNSDLYGVKPWKDSDGGGGGGFDGFESLCMIEMVEDEILVLGNRGDGSRGGLMRHRGDRRENREVNGSEGEDGVGMLKVLEGEKKAEDRALRVGCPREGFRGLHRRNSSNRRAKFAIFANLGQGEEGVEETGRGENAREPDFRAEKEEKRVKRRGREGYKKWSNNSNKGIMKEFGKGSSDLPLRKRGEGNCRGVAEKSGIKTDLDEDNGERKGLQTNGENVGDSGGKANVGDNEDKAQRSIPLEELNKKKVSIAARNKDQCLEVRASRGGFQKWHKKRIVRAKAIRATKREKARINEAMEQNSVVVGEIHSETKGCSDGLLKIGYDPAVSKEVLANTMVEKDLEKKNEQLGGEKEANNKGLLVTSEAYGERARFRHKIWSKRDMKGVSGAESRRDLEDSYLSNERVGNGSEQYATDSRNQKFQTAGRRAHKKRISGLIWVKKGDVPDAKSSEI